ncbi:metalloregulator ArsR/SmtB family transcription factor [soil metagenome]
MPDASAQADPFSALGDPYRRAIVEMLADGARPVGEIAAALPISRPAVSRHLRLLKEAGLVRDDARGTRRLYTLHGQGAEEITRYMTQVWSEVAARFMFTAENIGERD